MNSLKTTMQADWGLLIEQTARRLVPVLVAVYVAGYWLGAQIHAANDWLAGKRPVRPPETFDPLLLDVRALSNAGLGRRRIARQLGISEAQVRRLLRRSA